MKEQLLQRGIVEVIERDEIENQLKKGEKLRVKLGVDPTSPDIHLGHMVVVNKLREFQLAGHKIVLIIGDYTARIGDPSGKKKTRPILTEKEIEFNSRTYLKQVGKVLDMSTVEVQRNSKWFQKFTFADWLKLLSHFTVAQIMERDDFSNRFKNGIDIGMHELIYPAMQAYDSVMVKADVEIGGTDQKFNMLAGRDLQKKMDQKPQNVITVPLLVGTDGKEKMSKSLGNAIGVSEEPNEIYGKVMSINDEMILPYYILATDISEGGLAMVKKELEEGANPRDIKARLAYLITEMYHDTQKAEKAARDFDLTFKEKKVPTDIPEVEFTTKEMGNYIELLVRLDKSLSKSGARRLIEQGGVKVGNAVIADGNKKVTLSDDMVVQIGKRKFYKIKVSKK